MLTSYLSTAPFSADLHHGGFYLGGSREGLNRRILALRQGQLEKMPHAEPPPDPLLRDGVAGRWSRLEIATNVVGVICSPESREPPAPFEQKKTGAVRSDGP